MENLRKEKEKQQIKIIELQKEIQNLKNKEKNSIINRFIRKTIIFT